MSANSTKAWTKYAREYDPIKCGSIDGTDTIPHDHGIVRALNSSYRPNEKVTCKPERTIFIGRLHIRTTEDTLCERFRKFGKIRKCRVVRDIVTGVSKCYAFIEFKRSSSVKYAVEEMQEMFFDESRIIVESERERLMKGWKPRRLGGGFGGKKESGQLRFGGTARPFQKLLDLTSRNIRSNEKHKIY